MACYTTRFIGIVFQTLFVILLILSDLPAVDDDDDDDDDDNDDDDEHPGIRTTLPVRQTSVNVSNCNEVIDDAHNVEPMDSDAKGGGTVRGKRRRWTSAEMTKLLKTFGQNISKKNMPSGKQISDFAKQISNRRTVAQIRSQVHNVLSGKLKGFKN